MKHLPKLLSIFLVSMLMLSALLVITPEASASTTVKLTGTFNEWSSGKGASWPEARLRTGTFNYNAVEFPSLGYTPSYYCHRVACSFNMASIPAGSTITSATLRFNVTSTWNYNNSLVAVTSFAGTGSSVTFGSVFGTGSYDSTPRVNAMTLTNTNLLSTYCGSSTVRIWLVSEGDYTGNFDASQHLWALTANSGATPSLELTYQGSTWPPAFTSSPAVAGTVGSEYSYTPTTNESATITVPTLPAWATYSGGTISGTPSAAGTYAFHVHAVGPGTLGADQYWNVTISEPAPSLWGPSFTTTPSDTVEFGDSYGYEPACNESVTFSAESFPVWAGLVDNQVIGLPNAVGSYWVSLKATSTAGTLSSWQNWTITVEDTTPIPIISTSPDTNASKRVWYSYTPLASIDCTWAVDSTAGWIVINQYTGQVFGLPTSAGTYHVVITATSTEYGTTATQAYDLTVADYVTPPTDHGNDETEDPGGDDGGQTLVEQVPLLYVVVGLAIFALLVIVLAVKRP